MSRIRSLTLGQSWFLGEALRVPNFERKLKESPVAFLNSVVRNFRLRQPFQTVYVANQLKRSNLQFTNKTVAEWIALQEVELWSYRGGACFMNNSFLSRFLQDVGFEAHVVYGFVSSKSMKPNSFHIAVAVKNVEEEGDCYHCDVGCRVPTMRATKVDMNGLTEIQRDIQMRYQLSSTRSLQHTIHKQDRLFSPSFNLGESLKYLAKEDGLVLIMANDHVIQTLFPHLSSEPADVWVPFHIYPNFLTPFDMQEIWDYFANDRIPLASKLPGIPKGIFIAGFGQMSGNFTIIHGRRVLSYASTVHDLDADDILTTDSDPVLFEAEDDDQLLEVVNHEFPQLLEYCQDAIQMTPIFENVIECHLASLHGQPLE